MLMMKSTVKKERRKVLPLACACYLNNFCFGGEYYESLSQNSK
jgi:hypothetical protein